MWILQSLSACQSKIHGKKQESYPARIAPMSAMNHSAELNPRMPTPWKRSSPSCKQEMALQQPGFSSGQGSDLCSEHSTEHWGKSSGPSWGNSHWKTPREPRWDHRVWHPCPTVSGQENWGLLSLPWQRLAHWNSLTEKETCKPGLPVPLGLGTRRWEVKSGNTSWDIWYKLGMSDINNGQGSHTGYEISAPGVPVFNSLSQTLVLSQKIPPQE